MMDRMKELIKQAYDHNTLPDGIRKQRLSALLDREEKRSGGITMTKKRISKKLICLTAAAAAAAALAVTTGASAYKYMHKESVDTYGVADVEYTGKGFEAFTVSNEHFDLTIESVMSDGRNAHILMTLKPLDEAATNYLRDDDPDFEWVTLPMIQMWEDGKKHEANDWNGIRTASASLGGRLSDNSISFMADAYIGDLPDLQAYVVITYYDEAARELLEGLNFTLDFEANLETRDFTDSEGHSITATQIGFTVNDAETEKLIDEALTEQQDYREDTVTYKDGTTEELFKANSGFLYGGGPAQAFFAQTIDLDEAESLTIGGIEFK